jgi:alkanesulfonate monooxygenase SsuD/methylene tetrahydromethanopterin reductase-like flavin-dependent oxidoreductase (luciferase family)
MEIGIGLPGREQPGQSDHVLDWARRAESGGFSSLAIGDRVVAPAHEALVTLAAAAGVTSRIRLMASLIVGPIRETTLLARQAASIDVLSGGRLSLGIGVGARADDYAATGTPFAGRGRREEDQLRTLRRLWSRDAPAERRSGAPEHGPIGVAPTRPGGPEVLLGGYVPAVAQRIAAWGDGFIAPGGGEPAAIAVLWQAILDRWAEAGRRGRPRWVAGSYYALGPHADEAARAYIGAYYGYDPHLAARRLDALPATSAAVKETIQAWADRGVDELILRPVVADPAMLDGLAEIVNSGPT